MLRELDTLAYNNAQDSAFPVSGNKVEAYGLTKREYFALHLMSGLMANSQEGTNEYRLADKTVDAADALLSRLSGL